MDWIIGLALLVVGGIIGFFIARYVFTNNAYANAVEKSEENEKNVMAQQALHHIYNSRQTLELIQRECNTLAQQFESYEGLLEQKEVDTADPKLNYFGDQASEYLRNKQGVEKRSLSSADVQPKDFAGQSSGLFVGKNKQEVADNR